MASDVYNALLSGIQSAGVHRSYVESLIPDWLMDAAKESPSGLDELKVLLARRLGLEISPLLREHPEVAFKLPQAAQYKRRVDLETHDLEPAAAIAVATARIVTSAMSRPYVRPGHAADIRDTILGSGAKWVSLRAILQYTLSCGIPVIPIQSFPKNMKKMEGMAIHLNDRPAIVLSRRTPYSSWHAFILAHELGHIARGDLPDDSMIVDEEFQDLLDTGHADDVDEASVDAFALALLSGGLAEAAPLFEGCRRPLELAERALRKGQELQADPGHLLLRFAYETESWQLAIAALKRLDYSRQGLADLHQALFWAMDPELLSADNAGYLLRVAGLTSPD